ncbi:MAG: hypothetical protein LQ340_007965 [Diploschistes diacapsis]|nr:MAG: hypothetical protein LQ340_007965 [Diploschistes diacapsis]
MKAAVGALIEAVVGASTEEAVAVVEEAVAAVVGAEEAMKAVVGALIEAVAEPSTEETVAVVEEAAEVGREKMIVYSRQDGGQPTYDSKVNTIEEAYIKRGQAEMPDLSKLSLAETFPLRPAYGTEDYV